MERPVVRSVLGLAILLAAAGLGLYLLLDRSLTDLRWVESEATLRSKVLLLEDLGHQALAEADPSGMQAHVQRLGNSAGIRITLVRVDGTVLADSDTNPARLDNLSTRPEIQAALTSDFGFCRRHSPALGVDSVFVARALRRDGELRGWIRASVSTDSIAVRIEETRASLARHVTLVLLAALTLGIAGILLLARRNPSVQGVAG